MGRRNIPPYSGTITPISATTDPMDLEMSEDTIHFATPSSISSAVLDPGPPPPTIHIPKNLTQAIVDADPQLKRFQQDLLILTSFNENETLHWRPSWFKQGPFAERFWTLQNPPNVITERMPPVARGRKCYTRRMRAAEDSSPAYITSWNHWERYRGLYGIPHDFLCEEQVELVRLGLPRDEAGNICTPPTFPLYPEPQPPGQGRYMLDPSTYVTHLHTKFDCVDHAGIQDEAEVVVVQSTGALSVQPRDEWLMHSSQFTHFDGYGGYVNESGNVDATAPKEQGPGRRWSYLPWTKEQEESCVPFKLKLRNLREIDEEQQQEEEEDEEEGGGGEGWNTD